MLSTLPGQLLSPYHEAALLSLLLLLSLIIIVIFVVCRSCGVVIDIDLLILILLLLLLLQLHRVRSPLGERMKSLFLRRSLLWRVFAVCVLVTVTLVAFQLLRVMTIVQRWVLTISLWSSHFIVVTYVSPRMYRRRMYHRRIIRRLRPRRIMIRPCIQRSVHRSIHLSTLIQPSIQPSNRRRPILDRHCPDGPHPRSEYLSPPTSTTTHRCYRASIGNCCRWCDGWVRPMSLCPCTRTVRVLLMVLVVVSVVVSGRCRNSLP